MTARYHDPALESLLAEVDLKAHVEREGAALAARLGLPAEAPPELANLTAYLALRHRDLRPLQRRLMARGLSSLGRMESRVVPTLDAVIHALAGLAGLPSPVAPPAEAEFFAGEARLDRATDMLFGPPRADRRVRIMVTLPSQAADDPARCCGSPKPVWMSAASTARTTGPTTGCGWPGTCAPPACAPAVPCAS